MTLTQRPRSKAQGSGSGPESQTWPFGFRRGADLNRRVVLFLLLLLFIVWLVAGAYLVLASQTIVAARHVQALRDRLTELQKENAFLEKQIAARQAIQRLVQTAREMEFAPPTQIDFLEP